MKVSDQYEAYDIAKELLEQATNLFIAHLPEIKHIASEVTEILFVPKAITKQLVLAIALETGVITIKQVRHVVSRIYSNFSSRSKLIRQLQKEQNNAQTQDEWMEIADQIDTIQGNDLWRSDPNCPLYESDRISARIDEFVHLMRRNDIFDLMFTLRGGIARNKFGLLHEGLFSKALAGTKVLVETYHNVICTALDIVCDSPTQPEDVPIPTDTRLAFFNETRHSYGRTALMLSGGAALGFYHVGVVKALMENGLLPRVISGASAGSIVCAMIGTRTDDECREDLFQVKGTVAPGHHGTLMTDFFRPLQNNKRSRDHRHHQQNPVVDVLHNTAGAFADGKRTWQVFAPIGMRKFTSFLYDIISGHKRAQDALKSDTDHFRECCRINIGNFTFQEAFDRTGRILNIIVSPQNRSDPPRLLNYLTSPHVLVWTAAVASSSLPGVFEPNKLLVKDADGSERYETSSNHHFIDGSMEADLPMQQLSEMFNINHFIISQANPHAVVLASFNINKSIWANKVLSLGSGILLFLKNQVKQWFVNMIELIGGQRAAPLWDTRRGFFSQFFTQEYEGRDIDISLVPWSSHRSVFSALLHCIYNPSEEDFLEWIHAAECETWRYIPKIKSHVAVEMTLDRCVQRLRQRLLSEHHSQKSRARADTTLKMSARVPSFFTSASLVNLSGLGVTDRYNLDENAIFRVGDDRSERSMDSSDDGHRAPRLTTSSNSLVDSINGNNNTTNYASGWKGMGLRGNFSSGSLNRTQSGVGYYIVDENEEEHQQPLSSYVFKQQLPGEETENNVMPIKATSLPHTNMVSSAPEDAVNMFNGNGMKKGYVKTTSMANFYYRNASHNNLWDFGYLEPSLVTANTSRGTSESVGEEEPSMLSKSKLYKSNQSL